MFDKENDCVSEQVCAALVFATPERLMLRCYNYNLLWQLYLKSVLTCFLIFYLMYTL